MTNLFTQTDDLLKEKNHEISTAVEQILDYPELLKGEIRLLADEEEEYRFQAMETLTRLPDTMPNYASVRKALLLAVSREASARIRRQLILKVGDYSRGEDLDAFLALGDTVKNESSVAVRRTAIDRLCDVHSQFIEEALTLLATLPQVDQEFYKADIRACMRVLEQRSLHLPGKAARTPWQRMINWAQGLRPLAGEFADEYVPGTTGTTGESQGVSWEFYEHALFLRTSELAFLNKAVVVSLLKKIPKSELWIPLEVLMVFYERAGEIGAKLQLSIDDEYKLEQIQRFDLMEEDEWDENFLTQIPNGFNWAKMSEPHQEMRIIAAWRSWSENLPETLKNAFEEATEETSSTFSDEQKGELDD